MASEFVTIVRAVYPEAYAHHTFTRKGERVVWIESHPFGVPLSHAFPSGQEYKAWEAAAEYVRKMIVN